MAVRAAVQAPARASDRQLVAGALLALVSGAASAITRVRHDVFAAAQSGNQVRLGIALAAGDWAWVGVYSAVIGLYAVGVALGLVYVRVETRGVRWTFALALAGIFVLLDVLLVEALPDTDASLRALVASCSAVPLGALFAVTKDRIGMPACAMTGTLARDVERAMRRLGTWRSADDAEDGGLTHEDWLAFVLPLLFTTGAVLGVEMERHVQYALSLLSPGLALGLYIADLAPRTAASSVENRPLAATGIRAAGASTATRLRFRLDL